MAILPVEGTTKTTTPKFGLTSQANTGGRTNTSFVGGTGPFAPPTPNQFATSSAPNSTPNPNPNTTPAPARAPAPAPTKAPAPAPATGGGTGTGAPKPTEALLKKQQESIQELKRQDEVSKANTPADTVPDTTDTTTKVNNDGTTTTTTEAYTDTVAKEFDSYLRQYNTTLEGETAYAKSKFDAISSQADFAQASMITAINATYDVRTEQMKRINEAQLKKTTAIGLRNNRMRYTPDLQNSILTNQERSGIQELSKLDAERLRLIAEAQAAAIVQDLDILSIRMDRLEDIRSEQMGVMSNLYDLAVDGEKRTRLREELNTQTELQVQKNLIAQIGNITSFSGDLTEMQREEFAQRLGVTKEVMGTYVDTQKTIAQTANTEAQIKSFTNLIKLLNDAPTGMSFTFNIDGEEVEYTGRNVGDTKTYREFNKATNTVSFITLNESGEIIKTQTMDNVGTPYTASGGRSIRDSITNGDGSTMTFDQWLQVEEDKRAMSINRNNKEFMAELNDEYLSYKKSAGVASDAGIKEAFAARGLTPLKGVARNKAILNYVLDNPGESELSFNFLPPLEQLRYGAMTKTDLRDSSGDYSASSDEIDNTNLSEEYGIDVSWQ